MTLERKKYSYFHRCSYHYDYHERYEHCHSLRLLFLFFLFHHHSEEQHLLFHNEVLFLRVLELQLARECNVAGEAPDREVLAAGKRFAKKAIMTTKMK